MIARRKIPLILAVVAVAALMLACLYLVLAPYRVTAFQFSKLGVTVTQERFLTQDVNIAISYTRGTTVYYTTDGSTPDQTATRYTSPIPLAVAQGEFPNCLVLKAIAYYDDGTCSDVVTHTFFSHVNMKEWSQNLIMSISGDPSQLTDGPDGILYGDNVHLRGETTEREVYIEAISPSGRIIFEQAAGARVHGGSSREQPVKSLKLYARREYSPESGMFEIDVFGTIGADGSVIDKYDKLVLRNHGNAHNWGGFVLDDLNQQLATQAGHLDAKSTIPAVYYLNGEYQGFFWLQESVCEEYLKDKFGGDSGRFVILEAAETQKLVDNTAPLKAEAAISFNENYDKFSAMDLTNDDNYAQLCQFMDVENYLEYFAYNIYINSWDWPHNNVKCYRYYAPEDGQYGDDRLDGRWRFIYHDMDFSFGSYDYHEDSRATYNKLEQVLDPSVNQYELSRHSPLLAAVLKRPDCKNYFVQEILRLMNGVLTPENVEITLSNIAAQRQKDIGRYLTYMDHLSPNIFGLTWAEVYGARMEQYVAFAEQRPAYMKQFLIEELDLPADYFDS